MENINLVIGNNIKTLRKANKLTQYELAERLNYSNKAISRWESGEIIPDVVTLNRICEVFNIPISKIFEKDLTNKSAVKNYHLQIGNKLAISLLAILLVWFIATIGFVYSGVIFGVYYWQLFVWAIPFSCVLAIIFNSIWGKKRLNFVFITILVWSLLTCIYLWLLVYNVWPIFIIGIPMQVAIILWSNIIKNLENNKK